MNLGGDDLNKRLYTEMISQYKLKHDIDLTRAEYNFALSQLITEVEKVKVLFSERRLAEVNLKIHGRDYSIKVTRKRFNDICEDLF